MEYPDSPKEALSLLASSELQASCEELRDAYTHGLLGTQDMPEDTHPEFASDEERLTFFTLPMALNYQRNSYGLWQSATDAFNDRDTKQIFSVAEVAQLDEETLRPLLLKRGVALQPNKHVNTWHRISVTIAHEWGTLGCLLEAANYDFLQLQKIVQGTHKKGFPYLSGPKIFHYWRYILGEYGEVALKNKDYIQIAPDTHVIRCSIKLGVITEQQAHLLSRDAISEIWRQALAGTNLSPIDMHSPLWFWSKNKFSYQLAHRPPARK